jgi:hypothetical protein
VCTDNVEAFIAGKGCTCNSLMNALAVQLWTFCQQCDLTVSTQSYWGPQRLKTDFWRGFEEGVAAETELVAIAFQSQMR